MRLTHKRVHVSYRKNVLAYARLLAFGPLSKLRIESTISAQPYGVLLKQKCLFIFLDHTCSYRYLVGEGDVNSSHKYGLLPKKKKKNVIITKLLFEIHLKLISLKLKLHRNNEMMMLRIQLMQQLPLLLFKELVYDWISFSLSINLKEIGPNTFLSYQQPTCHQVGAFPSSMDGFLEISTMP